MMPRCDSGPPTRRTEGRGVILRAHTQPPAGLDHGPALSWL
jgi:hypothetical protein